MVAPSSPSSPSTPEDHDRTRAALVAAEQELAALPELRAEIASLAYALEQERRHGARLEEQVEGLEIDVLRLRGERVGVERRVTRELRVRRRQARTLKRIVGGPLRARLVRFLRPG